MDMECLFRELEVTEDAEFRHWARDNYTVGESVCKVWHPTVRDECFIMNLEAMGKGDGNGLQN